MITLQPSPLISHLYGICAILNQVSVIFESEAIVNPPRRNKLISTRSFLAVSLASSLISSSVSSLINLIKNDFGK